MMRRVYDLPENIVSRIAREQSRIGFGSEVETVRYLLNIALNLADTDDDLQARCEAAIKAGSSADDVCRDILIGHPRCITVFLDRKYGHALRGLTVSTPDGEFELSFEATP